MKTIKITTIALMLFLSTNATAQWYSKQQTIKGNGNVTTISRKLDSYSTVNISGFLDVILVEGTEGNLTLQGDDNLLEYVITKVDGTDLNINVKKGLSIKTKNPIIVTVPFQNISKVSLSGSGDIKNTGIIKAEDFNVSLSGSGNIALHVSCNTVVSHASGSGDIELKGSTQNLKTTVVGSGDFDGKNLKSNNVDVSVTGSGDASVYCNNNLKARVTGSGDVSYKGTPKTTDTKVVGSGDISN